MPVQLPWQKTNRVQQTSQWFPAGIRNKSECGRVQCMQERDWNFDGKGTNIPSSLSISKLLSPAAHRVAVFLSLTLKHFSWRMLYCEKLFPTILGPYNILKLSNGTVRICL